MISKQEVKHIAKLARLGLTEKEIEKMRKELGSILDYMEKLKGVDISKVEPTTHSIELENVTREDKVESESPEERKRIIELAPKTKEGYFKVKSIF